MVPEDTWVLNEVTPEDCSVTWVNTFLFSLSQLELCFLSFTTEICNIIMDSPFLTQSIAKSSQSYPLSISWIRPLTSPLTRDGTIISYWIFASTFFSGFVPLQANLFAGVRMIFLKCIIWSHYYYEVTTSIKASLTLLTFRDLSFPPTNCHPLLSAGHCATNNFSTCVTFTSTFCPHVVHPQSSLHIVPQMIFLKCIIWSCYYRP